MAIIKKLRNIRTLWQGTALRMVFFAETSHCAYAKVKVSLGNGKNHRPLSLLLMAYLGGFV